MHMGEKLMKLIIPIIIVFTILFSVLFIWVYHGEKKEIQKNKLNILTAIGTAFILALAPSVLLMVILLGIFGSTNIINTLFSLQISMNQLIILTIVLLFYLFTVDNILEMGVKIIIGKNFIYFLIMFLLRIFLIFLIGLVFNLAQQKSIIIAISIAFIMLLIDFIETSMFKKNTG